MAGLKENKPYEHYEDAYAVWYKKRPAHWKCEKFKYYFSEKSKQNAPYLKAGAISFGEVIYKDENNLSIDTKSSYQEVLAGEFVINPLNLNFDLKSLRTALSKINVVVSTGYIILRTNGLLNPHYARWLLHQFDVAHMKTLGSGVRQTINYNDIGNSFFCRPSLEEQKKIAAFLDYETIKIERLIRKQLNLIELLKEKRQAVISHAVTKGLNPDVPMKDSGVEWLDRIPEHWNILQVGRLYNRIKRTGKADKELLSVYREHGVIPKSSRDDNNNKPSDDLSQYQLVKTDDLVLNKMKAWQGSIAISKFEGIVSPAYFVYTPQKSINELAQSQYIHHLLRNTLYITQYLCRSKGIRINQWDLDPEEFKTIPVLLPPKTEQKEIHEMIDNETKKIDTLIQKQLQQIELLKERRTALIAAAVTGKIDLRNWTPPASSTEASLIAEEVTA